MNPPPDEGLGGCLSAGLTFLVVLAVLFLVGLLAAHADWGG